MFEADPVTYRNRTLFDTDPTNPGLAFGPYRIAPVVARQPDRARPQPDLVGRAAGVRPDRDQGDREHGGARGEPAVRRGRHDRGLGRPVAGPGAGLRAPPRRPLPGLLQARPRLRAHRRRCSTTRSSPTVRVRQALLYGLDRAAISQQLFAGRQPVADTPVHPAGLGAHRRRASTTPTIRPRPRALLDEAGWTLGAGGLRRNAAGEPLRLELMTTAGNRTRELIQQVVAEPVAPAGHRDRDQERAAARVLRRDH